MNIVILTLLIIVVVWVILIGAVFLVGLLSGKQQDDADEISDDKDVSILDVDVQDEDIKEQSIAKMNNIVEKESIFTRFLNLMHHRVVLPKPNQCLRFIWSKLKRIFVFKTLIILLILWPMLSLGYYLYLDNVISNGVNGLIESTDINAYNHPGATRFAFDGYTVIHDYCFSLSSLHPDIYISMDWFGNVFVTDEYNVGSDACCGWLGTPCPGHYLYFNVWIYIILLLIMICSIILYNRSFKSIICLCVFMIGLIFLIRCLLFASIQQPVTIDSGVSCTFLGNIYKWHKYYVDGINPAANFYGRTYIWLYNIYLGIITLVCPLCALFIFNVHKNKQK